MHTTKKALPSWHQQAILVSYRNSVLYLRRRISCQINMIRSERGITTHDSDITYPKGSFRQKLLQRILFRFFRTKCVCKYTPRKDVSVWKCRIQLVAMELSCIVFEFPTWIFCRAVSGFLTDCPCGVWGSGPAIHTHTHTNLLGQFQWFVGISNATILNIYVSE